MELSLLSVFRKRKPRKSERITKKTTKMIKKRNKAWNKYRTTNSDSDYKAYKELRNKVVNSFAGIKLITSEN